MKQLIIIAALAITISGCTSARISSQFSAGQMPCLPEDIIISNETASAITGMHNWVAECNGKKYVCSYHYGDGAKCTEMK